MLWIVVIGFIVLIWSITVVLSCGLIRWIVAIAVLSNLPGHVACIKDSEHTATQGWEQVRVRVGKWCYITASRASPDRAIHHACAGSSHTESNRLRPSCSSMNCASLAFNKTVDLDRLVMNLCLSHGFIAAQSSLSLTLLVISAKQQ